MDNNESCIKKLKAASDDLETKKAQLDSIEKEKAEVLQQLALSQEKTTTDLEAFKFQEDSLREEIAEAEATAVAVLMEKARATTNLERMTTQNASLSEEVGALKLERGRALVKLQDIAANLEDEIEYIAIENEQLEGRLQFAEGDLQRSIRLHQQQAKSQTEAHANDLARCDEFINKLSEEKSTLQEEVTALAQKVAERTEASEVEIAGLKSDIDELQARIKTLEADMATAQETAEVLRSETAEQLEAAADKSKALSDAVETLKTERDELNQSSTAKIGELQEDLDENRSLLLSLSTKLNHALGDLDTKREQLERLENEKSEALTSLELGNEENTALRETEEDLREEIAQSQEIVQSLKAEKVKANSLLEEATAQNVELKQNVELLESQVNVASNKVEQSSEDMKKMSDEHSMLIATLNTKISELAQELDAALNNQNELETKLKQVTDALETKETQLESLEHDKNEALQQLEASSGKHTDDIESFKLKDDALRSGITKAEETIKSLRDDKAKAVEKYKKASSQRNELSEELVATQLERDMMKESASSVPKLQKDVARLEVEKQHVEEKLKFAEANLGVVKASNEALTTTHENDLASRDELIRTLTEKKTSLGKQLSNVSQNDTESSGKVSMLQSEVSYLKEELEVVEKKEVNATSELEKCKLNYAKSVAFVGQQEEEFKAKIAALEQDKAKSDEDAKAAKSERDELKSKIASLEREKSPFSSSDPSQWEPSPVKPAEEPIQDTSFGADDTFDEDSFLPNNATVDNAAFLPPKKNDEGAKSDENASPDELTPSKTPFKKRRSMFDSASKKTATPAKRITRSRAKRIRTPLGPVQQTPGSSRKHRSNWSLQG